MYLNGAAKELHHFSRIEGISIEAYYPIARSCNNKYAVNNYKSSLLVTRDICPIFQLSSNKP